ncbi:type II secretion system F family protein [Neorhodopirellula lusitana]|uniref:type II secretion system F family protein n=1 Tax=Neorhodopirellula lusitana TaxID=445327 RepID=UPI0038514A41
MNITIVFATIIVAVSLVSFFASVMLYSWIFQYRIAVNDRLETLAESKIESDSILLFKGLLSNQKREFNFLLDIGKWLTRLIERAGWSCSLKVFLYGSLGVGAAFGAVTGVVAPYAMIPVSLVGLLTPFAVAYAKRNARQRRLTHQLPEVFQIISRAVRSGQTVSAALRMIAEDCESPIKEEFALCYEQQDLGMGRELALRKLAERTQVMELQIFVVALLVQTRTGGDLVELLDNLAELVQKRLRLKMRIRALTGEGRMQALVLILLPIVAFLVLLCSSPEYASMLLDRPYLLVATAASECVGAIWIRHIVNFEY